MNEEANVRTRLGGTSEAGERREENSMSNSRMKKEGGGWRGGTRGRGLEERGGREDDDELD
eukprot:1233796-Pyramimonas_sp.AAC.1